MDLSELKDQKNPLVMYFIINQDLDMSVGKVAAQCSHAMQHIFIDWMKTDSFYKKEIFSAWMDSGSRKRIKRAHIKEFLKIKEDFECFVVKDAGLTEVSPGSETVIVLYPMLDEDTPKIIRKLQLL